MSKTPADSLDGLDLGNGWTVLEKITRKKISTGGHFSVGYRVQNKNGKEAFLKALDFSAASQTPDPARALQSLLEAYNYERDLLTNCKERKLSRVMTPLLDGSVNIQGFGIYSPVYYLIFELASGDVRDVLDGFQSFDLVWCLRSLHNVAAGIQQLHGVGIAHQDVKPSNVIVIGNNESKIGDLGRASLAGKPSPHDLYSIAGDRGYAPPDLYYSDTGVDGFEKRFLADLYLLGSLFFFYFVQTSAVQALRSKLQGSILGNKSFKQDLPDLQHAFEQTIADLRPAVEKLSKEIADDILELVKQLCDPDPTKRGDPAWKGSVVPKYDLQRYISKLDLLSKKVESQLP